MYYVQFLIELQSPCPSIHPVWPTLPHPNLITRKTTEWHKNIVQDSFRQEQIRNVVEMRDSDSGLTQVLRCILWHATPLLKPTQLCVLHYHKPAFQLTNTHSLVHLLLDSVVCGHIYLKRHTDYDFFSVSSAPSHPTTKGMAYLSSLFSSH